MRLEVNVMDASDLRDYRFNSKLVRLKVEHVTRPPKEETDEFQFQTGSIKSADCVYAINSLI